MTSAGAPSIRNVIPGRLANVSAWNGGSRDDPEPASEVALAGHRVDDAGPAELEVGVPTVHRFGPYRFFFYADENWGTDEPPHIHVRSGNGSAKFWLEPVRQHEVRGYTRREAERIRRIVVGSREMLLRRWHEFFDQGLE